MNIIEKLKYHEKDQLKEWSDGDFESSQVFLKELVQYSKDNLNEIKQYCINTNLTENSSLRIIYEAFSDHSIDFNEFLFEEIKRVVNLAKSKKIKAKYLKVLIGVEIKSIYLKSKDFYIHIMEFLTVNLNLENDKNFNIELLDLIHWYLDELYEFDDFYEFDEPDEFDGSNDFLESEIWINRIKELANNGELSVKIKARETLEYSDVNSLNPLSFIEKIKMTFLQL